MSVARTTRLLTIWLWLAVSLSLLAWIAVGYPWPVCVVAVLPLLAPLHGLVLGVATPTPGRPCSRFPISHLH